MKRDYESESVKLGRAIDIAIMVMSEFPPDAFMKSHIDHFINFYIETKERCLNPAPEFYNLKSLKYLEKDILTYFQEASGKAVEEFWENIKNSNLDFKRENKLTKVLKRNRIKDKEEYDYVIDMVLLAKEDGRITDEEYIQLNRLIGEFEKKEIICCKINNYL